MAVCAREELMKSDVLAMIHQKMFLHHEGENLILLLWIWLSGIID
jgi:hypothetical protein